ncbi:hypothetical protein Y032_0057g2776 [Ancylostoma ceylanicum]|uniref:Uncharacterized protein n=1 Tax=Ancylostoma ceylanicum TaxID=53326 RepID=A0A016U5C1_9BILA|nr:hypothetical protein Y032_0057g2776 [Ancylostoma ceylanicum]
MCTVKVDDGGLFAASETTWGNSAAQAGILSETSNYGIFLIVDHKIEWRSGWLSVGSLIFERKQVGYAAVFHLLQCSLASCNLASCMCSESNVCVSFFLPATRKKNKETDGLI